MDKINSNADVLIAGAGPSGLMAACQLSLNNVSFRIVDKSESPARYSGAMIIYSRTMEIFQQMGLAEKVLMQGTAVKGLTVYFNGKNSMWLDLSEKVSRHSAFPFIIMMEQSKMEVLLLEFLKERGHLVEWETELVDVVQTEQEVDATLRLSTGKLEMIKTKFLIAADGDKSKIRELLNIPFLGKKYRSKLFIMECDADVDVPPGELGFSFTRRATVGFFPLTLGKWRIDASIYGLGNKSSKYTFENIADSFNRKTNLSVNLRNATWFSVFYSHNKYARYFYRNRCFLVGDAAHVFTPVGGQGMNTGIQDAHNLAWKMAMVAQNKMLPQILDTYDSERRPVAERICNRSGKFFKIAASGKPQYKFFRQSMLPGLLKLFFRLLKYRQVTQYFYDKISGTGISYSKNILNMDASRSIYSSAPKPGERLPYLDYFDKGKVVHLHDKIEHGKLLLLIFGDRSNIDLLHTAVKSYRDVIASVVIPFNSDTSDLYIQFGINTEGWYLIRPDMIIASRSDEPGAEELKSYLHTHFLTNRNGTVR